MKGLPLRRVERIFHLVADLDPAERIVLLDEMCAGDGELRREVLGLLDAHDGASILDEFVDVGGLAAGYAPRSDLRDLEPGEAVGPYRIVRSLGHGGMGSVYLAEQLLPVRRRVAIKLINQGLVSEEVLRRFEAERQVLALLDCPNIARILDAGAAVDGRPFFTMEHVDGVPITRYADQHRLDVHRRLELFLQLCNGIRHAHQRGIVHRDIKPTNILVTESDGVPVVKIIDFGVARILEPTLTNGDRTLAGIVLGTPEYMSPEQWDTGGRDVDIRSDVYSAGVLLFELLVGELPFSRRVLSESSRSTRPVTPMPSQRLTELADGGVREADRRRVSPTDLRRTLRGEFDWICLRALEADREDRYQTIGSFSDDIERALRDEAVVAGPPSAIYRMRKFARRHRMLLISASLVAVSLVAATAISSIFYLREQVARTEAEQAFAAADAGRRRSEAVSDFARKALAELTSLDGIVPADILNQTITNAIELVEGDPELDDHDRASVRITLGQLCLQQGDAANASRLFSLAEESFQAMESRDAYEHAESLLEIAQFQLHYDHRDQSARQRIARALEMVDKDYPPDSFEHAMIGVKAGQLLVQTTDQEGARELLREVRQTIRTVRVLDVDREPLAKVRVRGLMTLFRNLVAVGELVEAGDVLAEAKLVAAEHALNDVITRMDFHKSQGMLSSRFRRWDMAATSFDSTHALYRQMRGDLDATTLFYAGRHADALARSGRYDEAEAVLAPAIEASEQDPALERAVLYKLLLFHGSVQLMRGRLDEAGQDYARAQAGFIRVYPEGNSTWFGRVEHALGMLSVARGEFAQAETHFVAAHANLSEEKGVRAPEVLDIAHDLADVLMKRGEFSRAEELALSTHTYRAASLGHEAAATIESAALIETIYQQWPEPDALQAWRTRQEDSNATPVARSTPSPSRR